MLYLPILLAIYNSVTFVLAGKSSGREAGAD